MKTYDKDALILEYLTLIQAQDKELKELRASKKALETRVTRLKRDSSNYRRAALVWREAYKDLNEEYLASNKVVCDLVNSPISKIEQVINAYKENM